MESVGATASILTFVTVAFSATKSIYGALSAIKDGPEILSSINDEVSQLQSILQRILQVVSSTARPADRSKLEQMVKKCRDDLLGFEAKLRQLDVSGADGRRGQLWRKFKICFEEKDLDRIRHVIGRHVQLLTLYLGTIQDEQTSLIAAQSTEILAGIQQLQHTSPTATQLNEVLLSLQQLQQDMAVLQVSSTSAETKIGSSGNSSRVVELDDENLPISQQTTLDDTIGRLMRLLEKQPCTIEFDDAQEVFDDLERLLQSVRDDANLTKVREGGVDQDADVSKEMKLFTSLIFSAQSLRVNQTDPVNLFATTEPRVSILQQRKRKEIDTGDNIFTITTTKRRKLLPVSQGARDSKMCGWGFLGNVTVKSKTKNKMITLSINRGQILFDRFTSMSPRVIVCQILPNDSHVFQVASQGSVQDLMRLIVENKASFHDHDENGWSLLHHAVGNLPMLKFLVKEGLDVDEIAEDKGQSGYSQTNPLTIAYHYRYDVDFSEVLLYAGADPTVKMEKHRPILVDSMAHTSHAEIRKVLYRIFCISPFVLQVSRDMVDPLMFSLCHAWSESSAESLNPELERQTLDLLISYACDDLQTFFGRKSGLFGFFIHKKRAFSRVLERRNLLTYLISRGTGPSIDNMAHHTPSYLAYGSMCKPCSMSQSSLMGDLWDSVLDICGYDIFKSRRNYPRRASYKNGYGREIFEELWRGREERCPYWNDEPWPEFSNEEAESAFESTLGQGLCIICSLCFDCHDGPCYNCGICLLVFQYSCDEKFDPDHQHDFRCPRFRVGYFELCENCGHYAFRPKSCSDSDPDNEECDYDHTSSSSDEFKEEHSLSNSAETGYWGCDCEETISEDGSDGGVSL